MESAYTYDVAGRVTQIELRETATPANVVQRFSYGYDAVGNRTYTQYLDGTGDVYAYDDTYQLTGVKYGVSNPTAGYAAATGATRTVTYAYDAMGNRTSVTDDLNSTTYTVNNLNQYTAVGGTNYTHNTAGQLTGDGTWSYTYDAEGNITSASKTGTSVSWQYDASGRPFRKTVNGVVTKNLYDGFKLIEQRDATDNVIAKYVYDGGHLSPVKMIKAGVEYYFQQDVLGNITAVTDATGNLVESYTYDAYGAVTAKNASGTVLTTAPLSPFLFTGHKYSHETGLYLTPYRAYSSELGRWLQRDPIREAGGENLYAYVGNDPVNYWDPLGLAIMNNKTGKTVTVSGNVGGGHGHGSGAQAFGTVPNGSTGGGAANPVKGYPTRGEAEYAADPNNYGPHREVGDITDVNYVDNLSGSHRSDKECDNKLIGDEDGPTHDLTRDPSGNIEATTTAGDIGGAYLRRGLEKIGF